MNKTFLQIDRILSHGSIPKGKLGSFICIIHITRLNPPQPLEYPMPW